MRNRRIRAFLVEYLQAVYVATDARNNRRHADLERALVTNYMDMDAPITQLAEACGFPPRSYNLDAVWQIVLASGFERVNRPSCGQYFYCVSRVPAPDPLGFVRLWKLRVLSAVLVEPETP